MKRTSLNSNAPPQDRYTDAELDLRRAEFESISPGAVYAGATIRNKHKKRTPSDQIFAQWPKGKKQENLIEALVTRSVDEWRSIALLIDEAGMDYGSARRCKWEQIGKYEVEWVKAGDSRGVFRAKISPKLRSHLASLPRLSEFVCPTLAMMMGPWARNEFRKMCNEHLAEFYPVLRRYSPWSALQQHHDELAEVGRRNPRIFKAGVRDLKAYVRARLKALREGKLPIGEASASPCFGQYRALNVDELTTLAKCLTGEWLLAILLLFYLIIGVGELVRLNWDRLDLEKGVASLAGRRQLVIHPVLLKVLREWKGPRTGPVLSWKSEQAMNWRAYIAFIKAGMNDPRVRLSSIRRTARLLLKTYGIVLNDRGKIIVAPNPGGTRPTYARRLRLLNKAILKFPNIL